MPKVKQVGVGVYRVKVPCPCNWHVYDARWTFNGDFEKPTFKDSYLARTRDPNNPDKNLYLCHSWVTDGMIDYKDDGTTHELAGKIVPLLEIE